jgi:hypothetical protein
MHLIAHWLGLDNVSGAPYAFWSGVGGDVAIIGALLSGPVVLLRRHNCHAARCWRIGRYHAAGGAYVVCARHNPGGKPDHARIIAAHSRHAAGRATLAPGSGERLYDSKKDGEP